MAAIVDTIFLGLTAGLIFCLGAFGLTVVLASFGEGETSTYLAFAIALLVVFVVIWGYFAFFETIWQGQSPGKRWTGLRVIQEGGYPIGFSQAAIRNIVRIIDFLPLFYIIGAVVMLIDSRSRRLGDLVAGTIVVKEQQEVTLASIGTPQPAPPPWPAGAVGKGFPSPPVPGSPTGEPRIPNLTRLTLAEQSLLREYLQRRSSLTERSAASLSLALAQGFARRLEYVPTGDVPDQFLQRIARQIAWSQAPQSPSQPGVQTGVPQPPIALS
jgi:uncharacterized RDD family membrane protein YckC